MNISLVSGGYPPALDGIGDYTWWLAETLSKRRDVEQPIRVYTALSANCDSKANVEVIPFFDLRNPVSFSSLPEINRGGATDWMIIQYNPFSFGRRGFCPRVPLTLARLKKKTGIRIAVMFHETYVPRWPWRFAVMYAWQWPIFWAICRVSDISFVSAMRWMPRVRRARPNLPVHHLPVGSNIPVCNIERDSARREVGVGPETLLLGVFGGAHVSRRIDWIMETVKEASIRRPERKTALLYVGAEGNAIRGICDDIEFIDAGRLEAADVGVHLRAMDAVLAPFTDGMSTRRTSVISVLQQGIPVATTRSVWSERMFVEDAPVGILLSNAVSARAFAIESVDWLDRILVLKNTEKDIFDFYKRHFDWIQIASTMVEHLSIRKAVLDET